VSRPSAKRRVSPRTVQRRSDALSTARILEAAIDILDEGDEGALTFRALAARLATGSGAIYWHVAGKDDLLAMAADHVIAAVTTRVTKLSKPRDAIRTLAGGVFDAIEAHPWVGGQLSRDPWQNAVLRLLEAIGQCVQALGIPDEKQFHAASALMNFILGLAAQYAAQVRLRETDRSAVLAMTAARWMELDPGTYPFVRRVAAQLAEHDDREQFIAGIELILRGIQTGRSVS
jgi:AcrR family transcriptional regulator